MVENYAEFARATSAGPPDWTAIAQAFADQGFRGSTGKPPTPEGVRQTWWKVRRDKETRSATTPAARPAKPGLPPRQPPPAVERVSPAAPDDDGYHFDFGEPIR
jgi:hypothetical protein